MSKALTLYIFFTLAFQQLLVAQTDLLQQQPSPFGELSLMITPKGHDMNYFMSASILFDGKKKGWQNSVHLDVETFDLVKTWGGGKNYYSLQYGKNYSFQRKWFIAKSCSSAGIYLYQFALSGSESRTYGIVVSQSLEVGASLKKVNISAGFYLAVGYGYFIPYYEVSTGMRDQFKFTPIGNPFVKITFKK